MSNVLVIGSASLDVLHLAGQTVPSIGGAGLYTALAAQCAGARVGLLAPRPDPMSAALQRVTERLTWLGPTVSPDQLPRLEIAHHGGGRATLLSAAWGAVSSLTPDALPADLSDTAIVHVAALPSAERQLEFVRACRARGAARLSAGTYARSATRERDLVRELCESVDLFFLNENEANLLFGNAEAIPARQGNLVFVTLGERGALVIGHDHTTHIPGVPAVERDPTGAGDTFCGTTLAGLARGQAPERAAQCAVRLAAEMIGEIGPARLLAGESRLIP
jgi:ribokinase